jgi:TonB-linked SusC/RagA family outer membrane protein
MKQHLQHFTKISLFFVLFISYSEIMSQGSLIAYAELQPETSPLNDDKGSTQKITLKEGIILLEKSHDVKFSYEKRVLAGKSISRPDGFNKSMEEDLTALLSPFNLLYTRINDKHFVIKERIAVKHLGNNKNADEYATASSSVDQLKYLDTRTEYSNVVEQSISGKVTDETGEGVPGVNILVKGTTQGTISDVNGDYQLNVADDATTLVFSYLGYATQEISIDSRSTINIILEEDVQALSEVVISALGFEQKKDNLGSTHSVVEAESMTRSGEPNLLNSLAAKASNVQISTVNGDPGAGTNIRIRGANTISGASSPLIIIDGIPISNSTLYGGGNAGRDGGTSQQSRLNDINPNDIESMQILKGASAAAIWGSRAANGVVVIKTKSGKAGKAKISYKGSFGADVVHERIPMQTTYGQGQDGINDERDGESWGEYLPDRSGAADVFDTSGEFFESADGTIHYPPVTRNSRQTFVDENWDAVMQTGTTEQHNISISGGSDKSTYFFSVGQLDQEGIIRNSDYHRTNFRFNVNNNLSDWLSMSSKASYTKSSSNRIQQSSNTAGLMLGLLRSTPTFDSRDYIGTYHAADGSTETLRQRTYRRKSGSSRNASYNNPLWTINEQLATSDVNRLIMSSEMKITPVSWGSITLRGGVDTYTDNRNYLYPIGSGDSKSNGQFDEDNIGEREVNFDAIARASFDLNENISMQTTLGWNYNDRRRSFVSYSVEGFLVNVRKLTTDLNASNTGSTVSNTRKRNIRSTRGYATFNFEMYDQLSVNMSGALESASSISTTTFYPAVDVAWRFSEAFDLSNTPISFGKLRTSWGQVGVQPSAHRAQTLAESGFTYSSYSSDLSISSFNGAFRLDDDLGNPNLKIELKTEFEIGFDLRLFAEKVAIGATYYSNTIDNLLINTELTPSGGYDTQYGNFASMENKGFEMDLDYSIIDNSDFTFGVFGNYGKNKNEVTDLAGTDVIDLGTGSVTSVAREGEPLGTLWGIGSQTGDNGEFVLDDNGFPQATNGAIVLGDPNPDWRGGFGIRGSWKGLSLNVLFEHSQGGDFSPRTLWVLRRFGTTQETAVRTTLTEDLVNHAGTTVPAGTTVRGSVANFGGGNVLLDEEWYRDNNIGGGFGDGQLYNFSIKDATFTRLREVSLGYTFDSGSFIQKAKLSSVTFNLTGRNLFLWDDIEGIDPATNQTGVSNGQGLEYFTNPSTKSFIFSIAINY